MSDRSKIEWTDATWTPIRARRIVSGATGASKIGWHCEHVSEGCANCYAEGINKRLGTGLPFKPGHRKDIVEVFLDEKMLLAPLHWKKPRMIFVCSMTDLFGDWVKDEWIDKIFAVMALCPQHTFQVLTKRAERMLDYFNNDLPRHAGVARTHAIDQALGQIASESEIEDVGDWPLDNVWLGISAERQEEADERIPHLLQTPAAVRFVSLEPLLGPIDLTKVPRADKPGRDAILCGAYRTEAGFVDYPRLDWVIVGGESGPKARPMHPLWARSIRDQCGAAGVPFFFKQWGSLHPVYADPPDEAGRHECCLRDGTPSMVRGPKDFRLLDGRQHNDMPPPPRSEP